jgi:nucleotide-binding universal stress UspA family protein
MTTDQDKAAKSTEPKQEKTDQEEAQKMAPKTKPAPILVPVDFSAHSEAALALASELAMGLDAPLVVLHVVHDPGEAPGYYAVKGKKKQLRRMEDVAQEMLNAFMQKARKRDPERRVLAKAKTRLVVGLPVTRILQMTAKIQPRMIVMGSQGHTRLAHMLLGSKAESVAHLSPVPVTIVKVPKEA